MRPDYEDTEWRTLWRPELDEDDRWEPDTPPWWIVIIGALVMLAIPAMLACCVLC